MKQKPALFLSIGLTAFILVVLSALVMRAPAFLDQVTAKETDPAIEQIIAEREQEYIDALNQANQQIADMQAQMSTPAATEAPQNEFITAEEATIIGEDAAMEGYTLSGSAELVDYEGQTAYEVPFNDGLIYVDAVTGDVLFNGTIVYGPTTIFASDAARIASDYLKRQDARNVTLVNRNGQEVFRVQFPGGDLVFVSKYGTLLEVHLANSGSSATNNDHDDDDHEDHDDDDD